MGLKINLKTGGGGGTPASAPAKPVLGGGSRVGLTGTPTASASSLRDKFQRRSSDVLNQTYEQREERSKGSGGGKSLFNQEVLRELGVTEYKAAWGGNFIEVLPPSYDTAIPYFLEAPVHYGVGINKDAFLCMKRWAGSDCHRCNVQRQLFRQNSTVTKEIKDLYPSDRCIYLVWERTDELGNNGDQTYDIKIWAAPKAKVHAPIQSLTRDKLSRDIRDISDVSAGGQGMTVYFDNEKKDVGADASKGQAKATFPNYGGFDLVQRKSPIPEVILEKLANIIDYAENAGVAHPLEIFLHLPEDGEVKESMSATLSADDEEGGGEGGEGAGDAGAGQQAGAGQTRATLGSGGKAGAPGKSFEDQVAEELAALQDELMGMNPLKFKLWCRQNGVEGVDTSGDRKELVDAIVEALYEQKMGSGPDQDIPF